MFVSPTRRKGVQLELYDDVVLRDVGFSAWPMPNTGSWRATVRVHWEAGVSRGSGPDAFIKVTLSDPDGTRVASSKVLQGITTDAHGTGYTDVNLVVKKVKLSNVSQAGVSWFICASPFVQSAVYSTREGL